MKRLLILTLMLVWATAAAVAQQAFHSARLRTLDSLMGHPLKERLVGQERVVECPGIVPGVQVPVVYLFDEGGVCDHIGLRFLGQADSTFYAMTQVRMLEREFLAQLVDPNVSHLLRVYGDNKVEFRLNGQPLTAAMLLEKGSWYARLRTVEGITFGAEGYRQVYSLNLQGGEQMQVLLSASLEAVTGLDKREADTRTSHQLRHHQAPDTLSLPPASERLSSVYKGLYQEDGEKFIIPEINSIRYYVKEGDRYVLAHDSAHYLESFINTFLGYPQEQYLMVVSHNGYDSEQFEVSAHAFFDYFAGQKIYFGIENIDPQQLQGTIAIEDQAVGVAHLCYISTDLHTLLHGGTVTAVLHTNIPQYNIKNLYGERELERK